MLRFAVILFALIVSSACRKYGCLEGDTHKLKPSPEPNMHECTLYSESSCCYANFTEQLAHSPVIKVQNSYWNRCGQFSEFCEEFTKKIECFYRCSPHAARWIHPNYTAAIRSVPLCQSFCDDWYDACKDDSICVHNWLTDWEWDESGENRCKDKCIPYSKVGTHDCKEDAGVTRALSCVELFDTFGHYWTTVSSLRQARSGLGVAVVGGMVYAIGGEKDSMIFDYMECYDPLTKQWTTVASMNHPRCGLGVCMSYGAIYALGGWVGAKISNTIESFDPEENSWDVVGSMAVPHYCFGCCEMQGLIYVVGGISPEGVELSSVEAYNPISKR